MIKTLLATLALLTTAACAVMTDIVALTEAQKAKLQHEVNDFRYSGFPAFIEQAQANPHTRIFVAAFDGTLNDRDAVPKNEQQSIVGEFERNLKNSGVLKSHYYEGVGTRTNALASVFQAVTGEGSLERGERAYKDFAQQVAQWRREDPLVKVHVHTVSFSRGGGSALHFLNLVDQKGAEPPRGDVLEKAPVPTPLSPTKITSTSVMLDTVVTGQRDKLMLDLPKSTTNVLQVFSELEARRVFALTDTHDPASSTYHYVTGVWSKGHGNWNIIMSHSDGINHVFAVAKAKTKSRAVRSSLPFTRVQTISIPGVHSDIGGTYATGGIREVAKYVVNRHHKNLGFAIEPSRPKSEAIKAAFAHDSRWVVDKAVDMVAGPATRGHFHGNDGGWDGTVAVLIQYYGCANIVGTEIGKPGEGFNLPEGALAPHEMTLTRTKDGSFQINSSHPGAFSFDKELDRVTFYGTPIQMLGGEAKIRSDMAMYAGQVRLRIDPSKYLPEYVAVPNEKSRETLVFESDKFATPALALQDFFTAGMRTRGYPEQHFTPRDLDNISHRLAGAKAGQILIVAENDATLVNAGYARKPGEVLVDANELREAVGIASSIAVKSPTWVRNRPANGPSRCLRTERPAERDP